MADNQRDAAEDNPRHRTKRKAEVVAYAEAHPDAAFAEIGKVFRISRQRAARYLPGSQEAKEANTNGL